MKNGIYFWILHPVPQTGIFWKNGRSSASRFPHLAELKVACNPVQCLSRSGLPKEAPLLSTCFGGGLLGLSTPPKIEQTDSSIGIPHSSRVDSLTNLLLIAHLPPLHLTTGRSVHFSQQHPINGNTHVANNTLPLEGCHQRLLFKREEQKKVKALPVQVKKDMSIKFDALGKRAFLRRQPRARRPSLWHFTTSKKNKAPHLRMHDYFCAIHRRVLHEKYQFEKQKSLRSRTFLPEKRGEKHITSLKQ